MQIRQRIDAKFLTDTHVLSEISSKETRLGAQHKEIVIYESSASIKDKKTALENSRSNKNDDVKRVVKSCGKPRIIDTTILVHATSLETNLTVNNIKECVTINTEHEEESTNNETSLASHEKKRKKKKTRGVKKDQVCYKSYQH